MAGIPGTTMRSIRPYKSSEQYLYAMKEDLAEWLAELYGLEVDVGSFLAVLQTGTLLCHHANHITQGARDFRQAHPHVAHRLQLPGSGVTCNELAQPRSFQARDNVSNFIQWCRKEMAIPEVLMFETEDLVLRKNEKHVVLCLLEVARRASRFGMRAPTLIQMEEEIEEEIREDLNLPPEDTPLPKPQRSPGTFQNLDQMVQHLVSRCTCPVQFSMLKVSAGKYRVGESSTLIFVRILRNHVMVRVGGGWDTLEHYLDKHDPCRCTSLSHKQALKTVSPQRMQVQHEITARLTPRMDNLSKPQPALIVSRSQSPLPPVEWRTYAPHGPGGKVLSSSPPDGGRGICAGRRTPLVLHVSRDHAESGRVASGRVREQSATPSRRPLTVDERLGAQEIPSRTGRETPCSLPSSQQNGSAEEDLQALKAPPHPRSGRAAGKIQTVASLRERPGTPGIAPQRNGNSWPPGSSRKEVKGSPMTRSPSPAKHFRPPTPQQASKAPVGRAVGAEGAVMHGGGRAPLVKRLPSPVKHTQQAPQEDTGTKTLGKVGRASYRPPTPSQSCQAEPPFRNGGTSSAKGSAVVESEEEGGRWMDRRQAANPEALTGRLYNRPSLGSGWLDSRQKRDGSRGLLGPQSVPGSGGRHRGCATEKERVYTPQPIHWAEEQALYRSLEDEILANIKELEADAGDSPLARENLPDSFRTGCVVETDATAGGCNGPRLAASNGLSFQGAKKALGDGQGVPRSGVYVPERGARWHPAWRGYGSVIRELSRTLHQERNSPPLSSTLANGKQAERKVPETDVTDEEGIATATGDEASCATRGGGAEIDRNGDGSQAMLSKSDISAEGVSALEDGEAPPSKPRRSLKKPERVPSIYKLKLRPKIRPRRDHRPEKRPSKIPTPVAYRHAQRSPRAKGQARARPSKRQTPGGSAGNAHSPEDVTLSECSLPSTQDGNSGRETAPSEGKTERSDGEESWV